MNIDLYLRYPIIATILCGFGGMFLMASSTYRFVTFIAYICVLIGGFVFGHYVAKGTKK